MKRIQAVVTIVAIGLLATHTTFGQESTEAPAVTSRKLNQPILGARMTVEKVALDSPGRGLTENEPVEEIVEVRIASPENIPVRAIDPVLYIGKV